MQDDIICDVRSRKPMIPQNEKGSIIVIVIILLALLTIVGISATNTSVTEAYIVRNSGIHDQNVQLAELAAMEGLRNILSMTTADQLAPGAQPWMHDNNTWNDNPADQTLNNTNSAVPVAVQGYSAAQYHITSLYYDSGDGSYIDRGEKVATSPLRYYFVGWTPVPGESLKTTNKIVRQGRVVGVYDSPTYGRVRIEVGVLRKY